MKRLMVIFVVLAACSDGTAPDLNGTAPDLQQPPAVQTTPLGAVPAAPPVGSSGQFATDPVLPVPGADPVVPAIGTGMDDAAEDAASEEETASVPDMCGAAQRQDLLAQPLEIHRASFPTGTRIIEPGSIVTQDYRPQRLNVDVDDGGSISRIWCG